MFPYLKLNILPQKGSAVLWFNLMQSGEGENLMKHASCPVILGNKWVCRRTQTQEKISQFFLQVATKWIRERGQELRRPCFPENAIDKENEDHFKDFY